MCYICFDDETPIHCSVCKTDVCANCLLQNFEINKEYKKCPNNICGFNEYNVITLIDNFNDEQFKKWLSCMKNCLYSEHLEFINNESLYKDAYLSDNKLLYINKEEILKDIQKFENIYNKTSNIKYDNIVKKLDDMIDKDKLLYEFTNNTEKTLLIQGIDIQINPIKSKLTILQCPLLDCDGLINSDFRCLKCFKLLCDKCFTLSHMDKCKKEDIEQFEFLKSCKNCPKCKTICLRTSGCNHVKCSKCGCAFNWSGLEIRGFGEIGNSNPYNITNSVNCNSVEKYLITKNLDRVIAYELSNNNNNLNIVEPDLYVDLIIARENYKMYCKKAKNKINTKYLEWGISELHKNIIELGKISNVKVKTVKSNAESVKSNDVVASNVTSNNDIYWTSLLKSFKTKTEKLNYNNIYYEFILSKIDKNELIEKLYLQYKKILFNNILIKNMELFLISKNDPCDKLNRYSQLLNVKNPIKHLKDRSGWKGNSKLDTQLKIAEFKIKK
jgi:hypothetical protein